MLLRFECQMLLFEKRTHVDLYLYADIYIYMYICTYVCTCLCVQAYVCIYVGMFLL